MNTDRDIMKLALEGAANYIDALGGDSRKYRQALANEALNKKAENARELGLDYEPAPQEPVAWPWLIPSPLEQPEPVAAAEREKVAAWMMQRGYATGHGDTVEDLLKELEWQVASELRHLHAENKRLEKICYDYLGELTAMRAVNQMRKGP